MEQNPDVTEKMMEVAKAAWHSTYYANLDDQLRAVIIAALASRMSQNSASNDAGKRDNASRQDNWRTMREECARVADRSAEVHDGAMKAESPTGIAIHRVCINEAQWIAARIRALPSPPDQPPDNWRTMDSAPRDGKESYLIRFQHGHIAHAYLTTPEPPLAQTWRYFGGALRGQQCGWPTHWQPLPSPPHAGMY